MHYAPVVLGGKRIASLGEVEEHLPSFDNYTSRRFSDELLD
jgi:hypothetical protein